VFIGHFGLGFAARRAAPDIPLVALFGAAQFADLLWPLLVAAGIEQVRIDPGNTAFTPLDFVSYPYSHSLLLLIAWGLMLGLLYRLLSRTNGRALVVLAALVVSHWVLDAVTHRPDMPLYPGGPKIGLGLWNSVPWTMAVELPLYAAGVWIYARCTRARNAIGRWAFLGFAIFLVVIYIVNVLGPPPPSVAALSATAIIGMTILILWSWWMDHHRQTWL
jgi:hypothetical protein